MDYFYILTIQVQAGPIQKVATHTGVVTKPEGLTRFEFVEDLKRTALVTMGYSPQFQQFSVTYLYLEPNEL